MSFYFDDAQNLVVDGWKKAEDKNFSEEELAETYTIACTKHIEEEFPEDGKTLSNFLNRVSDRQRMQMFSLWREELENKDWSERLPVKGPLVPKSELKQACFTNTMEMRVSITEKEKQEEDLEGQSQTSRTDCSATSTETNWSKPPSLEALERKLSVDREKAEIVGVYGKYKPVAIKARPVKTTLPDEYRVIREIKGDPLEGMPVLPIVPPPFTPGKRYTLERKEIIDKLHKEDFMWPQERLLFHWLMKEQEMGFAWNAEESGTFREDFYPPVKFPVLPHEPWVERNIPIPPGIFNEVCKVIKTKIDAGVYEPSSSSYRSKWFCVVKKDGKSLRLVHSLEALNRVTIQYSGIPPATADVARDFAGRACGATLDLFVGYDERPLDVSSRDLTTFQTPFGPYRLVKLPMGWTNSVPIYHDDVTYILQDEIPHVTQPYVDDVPIKGPRNRYELEGRGYETIPGNDGIRRFVWEHAQNVNRVIQRMKYSGGTFSGTKAMLCCSETIVVGHRCTYEGRKPEDKIADVILAWPACQDKTDVRAFLGTANQLRMFIENYAKKAAPLTMLTADIPWEWGEAQESAMELIKEGIRIAPTLRPVTYDWGVVLAVDTSWKAVGWFIYQIDPVEPRKKYFCYFGALTLKEREARFSQAKRELFGLKLSLQASHYQVYGCRDLTVETDASYIKGMLDNPSSGPNATINRWIEEIRKYHFTLLVH